MLFELKFEFDKKRTNQVKRGLFEQQGVTARQWRKKRENNISDAKIHFKKHQWHETDHHGNCLKTKQKLCDDNIHV